MGGGHAVVPLRTLPVGPVYTGMRKNNAKNEYLITIFKGMQNVSLSQLYGHGYSVTYITHENMDCFKHCDSFWAVN